MGLSDLSTALHAGPAAATISGQVARFMLNGLRLPAPVYQGGVYKATGPMTGLYELVGQQIVGPTPPGATPQPDPRLTLTVQNGQSVSWLTFADSQVLDQGQDLGAVRGRYPRLDRLNPALARRWAERIVAASPQAESAAGEVPAGMIVLVADADSLVLELTNQQLTDNYPSTVLVPVLDGSIRPLPSSTSSRSATR